MPDNNNRPGELVAFDTETDFSALESRVLAHCNHPGFLDRQSYTATAGSPTGRTGAPSDLRHLTFRRYQHSFAGAQNALQNMPRAYGAAIPSDETMSGGRPHTIILDDIADAHQDEATRYLFAQIDRIAERAFPKQSACRALVPVSLPREVRVERFNNVALSKIDRPTLAALLKKRREMDRVWLDLTFDAVERLVASDEHGLAHHVGSIVHSMTKDWAALHVCPLRNEVVRVRNLLMEDGVRESDLIMFTVGLHSSRITRHNMHQLAGVFVCGGPGYQQQHFINASLFKDAS